MVRVHICEVTTLQHWRNFESLAESGHAESQHYLGVIYEEGRSVVKDAKAAIKWYLKAAQQGNKEARTRLERIYAKRRDTREKDEDALQGNTPNASKFFSKTLYKRHKVMLIHT